MFLRNRWYVAAWDDEIGERPLARTVLNEPIVLFRGADGKAAALEDPVKGVLGDVSAVGAINADTGLTMGRRVLDELVAKEQSARTR